MKNRSRSLTRSRSSNAFFENSGASDDWPVLAYTADRSACAIANVGIELDRALQVGNRFEPRDFPALVERQRIGVQRVERGGGRSRQRHVEFLDRRQRLAELLPQPRDRAAQRAEHLFLGRRFGLLARHHVAGLRVDRFDAEHVVFAEAHDRTGQQRLELLALRDLARDRSRDRLVGRALHQAQRLPRPLVRKHLEERRLLQRHRKRDLQRAVEHRLAGGVLEIGQHDGVLLGQRAGAGERRGRTSR